MNNFLYNVISVFLMGLELSSVWELLQRLGPSLHGNTDHSTKMRR